MDTETAKLISDLHTLMDTLGNLAYRVTVNGEVIVDLRGFNAITTQASERIDELETCLDPL